MSAKEALILDQALELLIETGDAGLTLRKLAERADMRLSNVQYYFRSRGALLTEMVSRYFEACAQDLQNLTAETHADDRRERTRLIVRSGLSHGLYISDMCRAFREIWAISSRDSQIDACLLDYYANFADMIANFICPYGTDEDTRNRIKALLVPFFEGYSITARALPLPMDETSDMLTHMTLSLLEAGEKGKAA